MPAPEELSPTPSPPSRRAAPNSSERTLAIRAELQAEPRRQSPSPEPYRLDPFFCDGCGRAFMAVDGAKLSALLRGTCCDCGGRFHLHG